MRGRPRLTIIVGGAGLVIAAAPWLVDSVNFFGPSFFSSTGPSLLSAVFLLGSAGVLSFGIRRESGIAGTSHIGKIALVLFGARNLVFEILSLIPVDNSALPVARWANSGLAAVFAVAVVVAAVVVIRAGVLTGLARWVLAAVAACYVIITTLTLTGPVEVVYAFTVARLWAILPFSLLVLGAAYLFQGWSAAVTQQTHAASGGGATPL